MLPTPSRFASGVFLLQVAACAAASPAPAAAPRAASAEAPSAAPPPSTASASPRPGGLPTCDKQLIIDVAGTPVWRLPGTTAFGFRAGMNIEAAGAPRAYHKDDTKALDDLVNAGKQGQWTRLLTDNGKPEGKPIVQGPADPAPGYFIAPTALADKTKPAKSVKRYVDASKVPYVALPEQAKEWGAELGDLAVVLNAKNGRIAFAILADLAPPAKLGYGSVALADAVGVTSAPRDGGVPAGVVYVVFPKSGNGAPRSPEAIDREGTKLFDALGGRVALGTCFR